MKATLKRYLSARSGDFQWVLEVVIFATVTPALVHGVLSLKDLPVA